MSRYQLRSKRLFLTYPQCTLKKEDAFQLLSQKVTIKEYVIAEEKHQNGDDHLHAYLLLEDTLSTSNPNFLDIGGFHGNYQSCRSEKNVVRYCTKAENFISNFDVSERVDKRKSKKSLIGEKLINSKRNLVELVKEYPELIYDYNKIKNNLKAFDQDALPRRLELPTFLPNPFGKILSCTLASKRRHYWIWSSEPNKGKTTCAKAWYKDYNVHLQSGDFTYWTFNGNEEALIIDEYNSAKLTWSSLNAICDGTFCYRIFQGGLRGNLNFLVIIFSNRKICDLYPNMNVFLYERFNEIEL